MTMAMSEERARKIVEASADKPSAGQEQVLAAAALLIVGAIDRLTAAVKASAPRPPARM
jgi:hypothetical protein